MKFKQFSFFRGGITSLIPHSSVSVEQVYEWIKSDEYLLQIEQIRSISDKKPQSELKSKLDYVTFSGIFSKRNIKGINENSNLICLDFDSIESLEMVCKRIYNDKYLVLGFISPSGKGLKLVIQVDNTDISLSWNQLSEYFHTQYGILADKSGKDISRACFLSHDPNAYFNPNASIFQIPLKKVDNIVKFDNSDLARAKRVAERIKDERIDITDQYSHWLNLGFALATFGEDGRELFHTISQFHQEYDAKKTDEKFSNCIKSTRFTSPAYFFSRAKECGISITKNKPVDSEQELERNEEIHRNRSVIYNLQDFTIEIDNKKGKTTVAEGFLLYIKYQTTDENERHTWILELRLPDNKPFYLEVSHDDFFEPKASEKIL